MEEAKKFITEDNDFPRIHPSGENNDFTEQEAVKEAIRCLHCDCRKPQSCKLRKYSFEYAAKAGQYKGQNRSFIQFVEHPEIIFEPGKCIDCGLCIQIVTKAGEELGLTFTGRGFNVRLAVPFGRSIMEAIKDAETARKCVNSCPTGALAYKISESDKKIHFK